ncbi:FAD-dependent oxidoreductase [Spongisporangium articulatum]|uniref:FAD-dependent oxidoreductase n=1 Tax=Spongisporangium articulatum TaxID=3362603 RepID=A0ABW8AQF5_9ACTN
MSSQPRTVIVVGGVAAGMSAATRLRRDDESLRIVVLERGPAVSFANCGLPYYVGEVISDREALLLQTPESLHARFALDVRVRHEVVALDPVGQTVTVRDLEHGTSAVERYDDLILATGADPVRPPLPGAERAYTLRDLDDVDALVAALAPGHDGTAPRTAVIVGGGFVGLELAENLHQRGLSVTVVEAAPQLLAPLDPEMAAPVQARLESHGVAVRVGTALDKIGDDDVVLSDGSTLGADVVILAVGVSPNSGVARAAGLALGPNGCVLVDARQCTSAPRVYAVGDVACKQDVVTGGATSVPLAQTANRHGRLVADVITGRSTAATPVLGTAVVGLFGMTVASTGWNEKRLRAAGRPYRAIHTHPSDHAGYYPGAEPMSLKLLVDADNDAILGAQAVGGRGVDKRIDVIATAMRGGLRASQLADLELAYAPQYGSAKDPVNMLGMIADNLAAGSECTLQWHELESELASGAELLDVRTAAEHAAGGIPGARNVPLDELRGRLDELPRRRLVVHCAVGQRGHVAARLLRQHGFDAVNLDGGYRTWQAGQAARRTA